VLRKAIAEADSLQEVSRLEAALQRGVLPDDMLHKVCASAQGAGGDGGSAATGAMMKATPAFPVELQVPASRCARPPFPPTAPGVQAEPVTSGHAVSNALLACLPADVRGRSLQAMAGLPPQPQASALGHCLAARGPGWPDVGAVGGEEQLAMPDVSALRSLSRALVAAAKAPSLRSAASPRAGDPFSEFLAEVGAEGAKALRSHPPAVVASTISAGRLFSANPQKALAARLRRAASETGAAAVAAGSSAEFAAAAFCERNWVNREVEARLLAASAMAQCAVVAEGPLLGANPSEQLAGRLLRVEAMTPGACAS